MGLTNRISIGGSAVSAFARNIRKTIRGGGGKVSHMPKFGFPRTISEE